MTGPNNTTVGLIGVTIFILFLSFAFGGPIATVLAFSGSFLSRWVLVMVAIGVMLYTKPDWSGWIFTGVLLLLLLDLGSQFGSHWFKPRFSPETGKVQTMMDPDTYIEFPKVSPDECAKRELGHCINEETGQKLIPYDTDKITKIRRNNYRAPNPCLTTLCNKLNSLPKVEPSRPTVNNLACDGRYSTADSCKVVTLEPNTHYDRSPTEVVCIKIHPNISAVTERMSGPGTKRYENIGRQTEQFLIYEVLKGDRGPDGKLC